MEQTNNKKKLHMPPAEIRTRFLNAADKREQIKILSELNLCSREDIRKVLLEQGVPEDDIPKTRARKTAEEKKLKTEEEKAGKEPADKKDAKEAEKSGVPKAVREAVAEKITQLTDEIIEKEGQLKELMAFIKKTKEE